MILDSRIKKRGVPFRRGDANTDGSVNLPDAQHVLNDVFLGGNASSCLDTADSNDDGKIGLSDGITILNFLFRDGSIKDPGAADCGQDSTCDLITCNEYTASCQ